MTNEACAWLVLGSGSRTESRTTGVVTVTVTSELQEAAENAMNTRVGLHIEKIL